MEWVSSSRVCNSCTYTEQGTCETICHHFATSPMMYCHEATCYIKSEKDTVVFSRFLSEIHTYIHTHVCTRTCMCTYKHTYTYVHIRMHVPMCACVCAHIPLYANAFPCLHVDSQECVLSSHRTSKSLARHKLHWHTRICFKLIISRASFEMFCTSFGLLRFLQ